MALSTPGLPVHPNSLSLLKLTSIHSVMPSSHLILCCPLLHLPLIFPSFRVFSNESALRISWPKYWSFSLNISPFNGHSGLISFRMDWLGLLAVQGTLRSLLQHHRWYINGQSCLTPCDPMDCSLPGSSVQGILQERTLEWVAMLSSTGSSQLRDWTGLPHCRQILYYLSHQGSILYIPV